MSEETKDKETAEAGTEEPVSPEAVDEEPQADSPEPDKGEVPAESKQEPVEKTEPVQRPVPAARPARATSPVAWLALFLSLLTLAAVGYVIVEDRRTRAVEEASSQSLERLAGRVDESRESLSTLDASLEDLVSSDEALESRIAGLQDDFERQAELLESLPGRVSNLENSVAALQGASAGARDTWLPALTDVRRALTDELAALEAMEKPDLQGATLTLASLARVVDSLPLRPAGSAADDMKSGADGEPGAAGRAWASVKEAMSGLVKVTPPDEETRALLTPDAARLIRSNLALQLQAARLALLRGEQAIFEQSLEDADALLEQYFDGGSAQVASAQATIAEIRDSMVAVTAPDISESLRLIRQFRVLSETAQ
jgi:uroporphyrin-3 C-methyltransferase